MTVQVTYDVAAPEAATVAISLEISSDGGATYNIAANTVTGHIGSGVAKGTGRVFVWNAGVDWSNRFSTTVRFRITATDEVTAPPGFYRHAGGQYSMGDNLNSILDAPVHTVALTTFYLQADETTIDQWTTVRTWALANGYRFTNAGAGKATGHPVQMVNWYDVVKWCNAKSEMEGLVPCYYADLGRTAVYKTGEVDISNSCVTWSANGYRLPTEAEWEYAANYYDKRFPFGDTIKHSDANYYSSSLIAYDTSPTRGYHPTYAIGSVPYTSPAASLDSMAGNVSEWCWDWYGAYATGKDPHGPESAGSSRVIRGGSWIEQADIARRANRDRFVPASKYNFIGFRQARSNFSAVAATGFGVSGNTTVDTRDAREPVLVTLAATRVGLTTATLAGTVDRNGLTGNYWFDWGTSVNSLLHRTPLHALVGTGADSVTEALTGLMPATTYFYRIGAKKSDGVMQFGGVMTFRTDSGPVASLYLAALEENAGRYTLGYDLTGSGFLSVNLFYSLDNGATQKLAVATIGDIGMEQTAGAGKMIVWDYATAGLINDEGLGTTLKLIVNVVDSAGLSNTSELTTAAPATQPAVVTFQEPEVGTASAMLGGSVDPHGLSVVTWFEWGTALEALTNRSPYRSVSGAGAVTKNEWIENLTPGTLYYYRIVAARTGHGPVRGAVKTFLTDTAADRGDAELTLVASGKPSEVGPKPGFFKITRGGETSQPMRLLLQMRGSAVNGLDYDTIPESITLSAGEKSVIITLMPKADSIVEGNETALLYVVPTGGYRVNTKGAKLTILEDDKLDGTTLAYPDNAGGIPRTAFKKQDMVGAKTGVRWYRISGVPPRTPLNLTVTGPWDDKTGKYRLLSSNVTLALYDETGGAVKMSANPGNTPEWISERVERGGDYFAAVSYVAGFGASQTQFTLTVSAGENWALVEDGGEVHHVGLVRSPESPDPVPGIPTWIVSHGRRDQPGTFLPIGTALSRADPGAQVYLLDWRTAAAVPVIGSDDYESLANGRWFVKIGQALAARLSGEGMGIGRFSGSELSYVGHSWGSYICYEIAKSMKDARGLGPASRFVALDPAKGALYYGAGAVNFSSVSFYSMGFQSSVLGNEERVADCNDGFYIRTPLSTINKPTVNHSIAHYAFYSLLMQEDNISGLIKPLLFSGASPEWAKNPDGFDTLTNYRTGIAQATGTSEDSRFEGAFDVVQVSGSPKKWYFKNFYYLAK